MPLHATPSTPPPPTTFTQRRTSLSEPHLAELARQVLAGLAHLHGRLRIVHRDIKPSNLLLSAAGQLCISDFGVSGQLSASMSKCVSWVGTVTYMSPEVSYAAAGAGGVGIDSQVCQMLCMVP